MAVRLVLPHVVPPFVAKYPDITLDVTADERFVDIVAEGYDAGIRFEKRLEQDMVAVPIGPRRQRIAAAASPSYLARKGRPKHPRDLLEHECLRGRFMNGPPHAWTFTRRGETFRVGIMAFFGKYVEVVPPSRLVWTNIEYGRKERHGARFGGAYPSMHAGARRTREGYGAANGS